MAERDGEQLLHYLRERPRYVVDDKLSEDEADNEEIEHEENDIQDADEDSDFDEQIPSASVESYDEQEPEEEYWKPGSHCSIIKGKNNFKWSTNAPKTTKGRRSFRVLPSAKLEAQDVTTPLEAWSLLFPENMLEIIVKHTNEEIERKSGDIPNQSTHKKTDLIELKALLGLLYFSGLKKDNHTNATELWTPRFGCNFYRAVMTEHRFHFLLTSLRFDDKDTRSKRRSEHGLATIKEIWDLFISNCQKYYSPSTNCTIDEQLLGFRGRFGAKVYMPSKPDRIGIKIVSLNDSQTLYMFNAEPHVGRVMTNGSESVPSYYIRKLSVPIYNTDRNVTCDNWFTSIDIVKKMKTDYSVTMVGTLRKNKREIPASFTRTATAGTVRFAYADGNTLVSYCPKRNKVVLLISSLHGNGKIDETTGKPEIITFYNHTKGGTDAFEQMCKVYSTARITPRWQERIFYGMLDQGGINSMILYNLRSENRGLNRREFLRHLSFSLVEPLLKYRIQKPNLPRGLKILIREMLETDQEEPKQKIDKLTKRKRCSFCPWKIDRKTMYCCAQCGDSVCEEHRTHYCKNCTI